LEGLLSPTHIIFILVIVLVIFGPGKLPQLGKGLGEGIKGFKEAIKGGPSNEAPKSGSEEKNTVNPPQSS
jgi:sec-independent protein translocase protein TatA